jgi:hypothetical protein
MSGGTEQAQVDSVGTPAPAEGWRNPKGWRSPMYVATVDIAEPIADLKCVRSVEPSYTGAWILVCDSGYPVGCVEVPVDGDVVSAAKIMHAVRSDRFAYCCGPPGSGIGSAENKRRHSNQPRPSGSDAARR